MKPPLTAVETTERMRNLLAFLLVGSFISTLPVLFVHRIPAENKEIITYILGQLSGMALTVIGFYFVSKVGQEAVDAKRAETSAKMADAVTSIAAGIPLASAAPPPAGEAAAAANAADTVVGAAENAAAEIKEQVQP